MPVPEDTNDAFESLRESHEAMIDNYFPQDEDGNSSSLATWSASPGSSLFSDKPMGAAPSSHSVESLQGKPQFNLASAEALLAAFRPMLDRFPCIVLPDDATVPQLAASQPFVLLAILAVGSGSKTLQGHSLYDDEFRKVLGLKFVAGGERTLELLQGMLVYCAWYPFQLRPKNKQVFHYIRMAADLIHDLELDQEIPGLVEGATPSDEQLAYVRAYLGHSYLISS
jgi:hypothetical protein